MLVVQNQVKRTTPTCPLSRGARCSTVLYEHRFPRAQLSFHLDDSRFRRKRALMLLDVAFVAARSSTFEIKKIKIPGESYILQVVVFYGQSVDNKITMTKQNFLTKSYISELTF